MTYGELLNLAAVADAVPRDVVEASRLYRVPVAELVGLLARNGRTFGDLEHDAAKARGRKWR